MHTVLVTHAEWHTMSVLSYHPQPALQPHALTYTQTLKHIHMYT